MRRPLPITLAVVAVLVLVLSGCGDDDGSVAATTTAVSGSIDISTTTSTTPPPPSTTPVAAPVTVRCGTVGFTPDSEDAAGDIMATGVSCAEARSFVEMAGRRTSSGGPQEIDVSGYHCQRTRSEQEPLPQAFYTCRKGSTTITFVRS